MSALLLLNGRLIDPANGVDAPQDLLLLGGKVAAVGNSARDAAPEGVESIDLKGLVVCPGLIDRLEEAKEATLLVVAFNMRSIDDC